MATTKKPAQPAVEKRKCPVSRKEFADNAKPLTLNINGEMKSLTVKEFSTGSFGWNNSGKQTVMVGDVPVDVQVGVNLTVIGSKELPK